MLGGRVPWPRGILLAGLLLLAGVACRRPQPHGILLFVFDAAGPSHFSAYGYPRPTTPVADGVAREGVLFANAFSTAPYTLSSFASIFTSKYPMFHGVVGVGDSIAADELTLPLVLREHGFETGAFVSNPWLSPAFGFGRGFDRYENYSESLDPESHRDVFDYSIMERDIQAFLAASRDKPFFLLVHVLSPHAPYSPPPQFVARFRTAAGRAEGSVEELLALDQGTMVLRPGQLRGLHDLYDANLNHADSLLGGVLSRLEKEGRLANTDVWITSDHGEAFGEHGRFLHGSTVYDEMIRVPLIVRLANHPGVAADRTALADGVDLFPSIAEIEGLRVPAGHLQGQSLWNPAHASRKPYTLSCTLDLGAVALRSPQFKYIRHDDGREEYFDLREDPAERKNLFGTPGTNYSLAGTLAQYQISLARLGGVSRTRRTAVGERTRTLLRSLGYLVPTQGAAAPEAPAAPADFRVAYVGVTAPSQVWRGSHFRAEVRLRNVSSRPWSTASTQPVMASYHWYDAGERLVRWDGLRTSLPADVEPGAETTVSLLVLAPDKPGTYRLTVDLLRESVGWFSASGSPTAVATIEIR